MAQLLEPDGGHNGESVEGDARRHPLVLVALVERKRDDRLHSQHACQSEMPVLIMQINSIDATMRIANATRMGKRCRKGNKSYTNRSEERQEVSVPEDEHCGHNHK